MTHKVHQDLHLAFLLNFHFLLIFLTSLFYPGVNCQHLFYRFFLFLDFFSQTFNNRMISNLSFLFLFITTKIFCYGVGLCFRIYFFLFEIFCYFSIWYWIYILGIFIMITLIFAVGFYSFFGYSCNFYRVLSFYWF